MFEVPADIWHDDTLGPIISLHPPALSFLSLLHVALAKVAVQTGEPR